MVLISARRPLALLVYFCGIAHAAVSDAAADAGYGRATFYGEGDGFTLNDGSCACHKQDGKSSWLSNQCADGFCFDYIGMQVAKLAETIADV